MAVFRLFKDYLTCYFWLFVGSNCNRYRHYSLEPPGEVVKRNIKAEGAPRGRILPIDATMKWPYPCFPFPKSSSWKGP
jgi:hypothetical protein